MLRYYKNLEQRSPEWFKVRAGIASGTMMKQVVSSGATLKGVAYKSIAGKYIDDSALPVDLDFQDPHLEQKIRAGVELSGRDFANRGLELEGYVIGLYEKRTQKKVVEMGFVKLDDYIGCSPDGLIREGRKYVGGVEIKCLLGTNHLKLIDDGFMKSEFKTQVLNYFICIDTLEWVDCVAYHPGAKKLGTFQIERIYREDVQDDINKQREKVSIYIRTMNSLEEDLLSKIKNSTMINVTSEKMYGVSDVANMFAVTPATVRNWCRTGKMPAMNVGSKTRSHYRILGSDILELKNK